MTAASFNPLFRAALVLGFGLGGFIDGILLHQILGWHHLICTTATCQPNSVDQLQRQISADGWFHLGTWMITVVGVLLLFRALTPLSVKPSGKTVVGGALSGWGVFNLVEGLLDHQILGIHHVRPESPHWLWYDHLFLAAAVMLIVLGCALRRHAEREFTAEGDKGACTDYRRLPAHTKLPK